MILRKSLASLALATLLAAAAPGAGAAGVAALPGLALTDQYGASDTLGAHAGRVVIAFVVTAKRLRTIRPWERDLRELLADVDYVRVADIPAEPPVTHERVAGKLRLVVPPEVSVLVDMERAWATALSLDTSEPNLLVFNRQGQVAARFRGRWHPASVPKIAARVKQILDAQ